MTACPKGAVRRLWRASCRGSAVPFPHWDSGCVSALRMPGATVGTIVLRTAVCARRGAGCLRRSRRRRGLRSLAGTMAATGRRLWLVMPAVLAYGMVCHALLYRTQPFRTPVPLAGAAAEAGRRTKMFCNDWRRTPAREGSGSSCRRLGRQVTGTV